RRPWEHMRITARHMAASETAAHLRTLEERPRGERRRVRGTSRARTGLSPGLRRGPPPPRRRRPPRAPPAW
ncbi:hypothetical protein ABZ631_14005, partial [Nocardiopsis alba]